jgi:hypothetical protein
MAIYRQSRAARSRSILNNKNRIFNLFVKIATFYLSIEIVALDRAC